MSESNQEQDLPGMDTAVGEPARKRAAKKAAKKVATKAAKKAVKKVAKKAAKKAAKTVAKTLPKDEAKEGPAPVADKAPAAKKEISRMRANPEAEEDRSKKFGRVPGGGPVVSRSDDGSAESASESSGPVEGDRDSQNNTRRDSQNNRRDSDSTRRDSDSTRRDSDSNRRDSDSTRRDSDSTRRDSDNTRRDSDNTRRDPNNNRRRKKRRRNNRRDDHDDRSERSDRGVRSDRSDRGDSANDEHRPAPKADGPKVECNGMLELAPKGFGFLRVPEKGYEQARDDVFVPPDFIRKCNLRLGQWIHGLYQEGPRGPQLVEITTINGMTIDAANKLPHFDELKAINPNKRISFETTPERYTTRVIDIMAPIGRGQRGLIVSPPRSGKTTLLLHTAEAIREKYDESMHLMVVLVDERPEEVTEFRRALPDAEIYSSSNDELPRNHCRIAELAIERAKRLVEAGQDVFLLMDSITRLARAYNNSMGSGGKGGRQGGRGRGIGSGGIMIGALEVPRRLFAAARNTRGGGSLTILATALIQTNSRADDAIFMEFKGTGNMELVLDRKIAESYIYPAVDIFKSGTRREELLLPEHMLHKIHLIRRGLSGHRPVEAMERLLFFLKKFPNNPQMLLEIKG